MQTQNEPGPTNIIPQAIEEAEQRYAKLSGSKSNSPGKAETDEKIE